MKRQNSVRRTGAVLLMILGIMAMFAISVLTYMVVTSNMAETAQNSAKMDSVLETPVQEDINAALKNIALGSNNERNPIGPFSILENMYGDWKEFTFDANGNEQENNSISFVANLNVFPNLGIAIVSPRYTPDGLDLIGQYTSDAEARRGVMSLFEGSGGVMTFLNWDNMPDENAENYWNSDVENTSAFILEKVVTSPTSLYYKNRSEDGAYWVSHYFDSITENESNQQDYLPCDRWHFKVELTDDLKRFANDYCGNNPSAINDFNRAQPQVVVRLNRPAYSGTGAGGFTPGEAKDASVTPEILDAVAGSFGEAANHFRIPFAFWGNAAAPDLYPFYRTRSSVKLSFRSFWAHLTDVNYDAHERETNGNYRYAYLNNGAWQSNNAVSNGFQDGAYLEPVRMNPAYTAPDNRTLFLANYAGPVTVDNIPAITPSFHRPSLFATLVDQSSGYGSYVDNFQGLYQAAGKNGEAIEPLLTALIRKLTPRPLPNDHWNFSGGNDYLAYKSSPSATPLTVNDTATRLADSVQWDVDNDGDGVREGIWIPSGLPIRVDQNGTPYATMFSYTVLDLDGRVNVNTAGNWDQVPHTPSVMGNGASKTRYDVDGNVIEDNYQPYSYVDELAEISSQITGDIYQNSPYYDSENLNNSIGWLDDRNVATAVAPRGDGRGTTNVLLYNALEEILSNRSTYDVATVASNMLWRRNLSLHNDPLGAVDQSNLNWDVYTQFTSQPGYKENGSETDDALGTRVEFFRYMDPVRLAINDTESTNGTYSDSDTASLGEAKMIFPYRGKTTVNMGALASSAVYDFANSAFRSYDPLGAQIYSYAPRYSTNPYLAYQNVLSWKDSPYTLPMLERLLRPSDSDANALPSQLVDDMGMNSDMFGDAALERERVAARQALTTISSDVPAPSLVFPEGNELEDGQYRAGHFGFADLIRRCVVKELYKAFEAKGVCQKATEQTSDTDGNLVTKEIDGTNLYLESGVNADVFNAKVEEITLYLVSMLPPEIMAGEKIDLNALSQKNYWLDVDYDASGNLVASSDVDGTAMHNVGLTKRMECARGLYIVLMTLLYEDMNAKSLYGANEVAGDESQKKIEDYIEGSFDLLSFEKGDRKKAKGLMAQELTATRIAQWCVNTIDFSDPDATMTPFFFDPTPFDGWWVYDNKWIDDKDANGNNRWEIGWGTDEPTVDFLFSADFGTPNELMNEFFRDAFDHSVDAQNPELSPYNNWDYLGINIKKVADAGGGETEQLVPMCSNSYIAKWMTKKIDKLEDQSGDLGFRLVWGMERPDLLLTETLNFHDLGIADTQLEGDTDSDRGTVRDGIDDSFDQVKRPIGSTYLELYCTANPNVPQSRELYDYDNASGVWKLRLSKKTPLYTDSLGRKLEMPIWRVAISASADARGLNSKKSLAGLEGDDKTNAENSNKALKKGTKVVYNKKRNSVLEWLSPSKGEEDDEYSDDISFFSLQPRQFRNLPTRTTEAPGTALEIKNIANLDLDQGLDGDDEHAKVKEPSETNFLKDWKEFNVSSSNILGPAVAATDDDARTREVELDRIVWFSHGLGDSNNDSGLKLGVAGAYPDALRTFCNEADEIVYLEPNQYLVVGPEKERAVGSLAFNAASGKFGQSPKTQSPNSMINLEALGNTRFSGNYKYMVAKANIGGRGLNISEPLWTGAQKDPYVLTTQDAQTRKIDPTLTPGTEAQDDGRCAVIDIPFELPKSWSLNDRSDVSNNFYDETVSNYPIVQDELFGLGTVPAYKSAFVQRVADPNRPYHPLMNPYITVDWNMMDLTVFTGECLELGGGDQVENKSVFTTGDKYAFKDNENKIKLSPNLALGLNNGADTDKPLAYNDAFSSRQWGNSEQKTFAPTLDGGFAPAKRPNPWARAFKGEGNEAGLEKPTSLSTVTALAFNKVPKHTLGMYNDIGKWGSWVDEVDASGNTKKRWEDSETAGTQFKNLNMAYLHSTSGVYMGAPRIPFEHLVWNDAPYSNPMELMLVPASAPGRFGLEFVREKNEFQLSELYKVDPQKKSSLGSFGVFGFKGWYNDDNIKVSKTEGGSTTFEEERKFKDLKDKAGVTGPYLNFFVSSKAPGETLNLCKALEFVYVPSLFLGTKRLAGKDSNGYLISDVNGNALMFSKRREPGKININTVTKPAWQALTGLSGRVQESDRLPGTDWDDFQNARYPFETYADGGIDADGNPTYSTRAKDAYTYFQPAQTLGLWVQLDGSKSPVPTYTTLLAQQDCDVSASSSEEEEPLFDNLLERYDEDASGNTKYTYKDPVSGEFVTTSDTSTIPADTNYTEVKTERRNNLFEATAEMQRLSGMTTNRSNVFAVWVTTGYFEVERCNPGVNMPKYDPDGNELTFARLINPNDKWYFYYQAIYPDGYTYGKELGSEYGEMKRHRGFSIIDRSIPVDYRRGNSNNWENSVLLKHILD